VAVRTIEDLVPAQRQTAQPLDQVSAVLPVARQREMLAQLAIARRHIETSQPGGLGILAPRSRALEPVGELVPANGIRRLESLLIHARRPMR
jgi:hypothetical protein